VGEIACGNVKTIFPKTLPRENQISKVGSGTQWGLGDSSQACWQKYILDE
jgi:hypothetical protein